MVLIVCVLSKGGREGGKGKWGITMEEKGKKGTGNEEKGK
jgi:hypothetical protein